MATAEDPGAGRGGVEIVQDEFLGAGWSGDLLDALPSSCSMNTGGGLQRHGCADFSALEQSLGELNEAFCLVSADTPDNKIVHVNQFWASVTGYRLEEAVGSSWAMLLLGRSTSFSDANKINAAITSGQSASICLVSYKKNGIMFRNHIVVLPVGRVLSNGTLLSIVCLMMREIP